MSIKRKVQLIEKLFHQLEQENVQFQKASGISCPPNCGKCCTYHDLQASPLEFLPWAFSLFLNNKADITLDLLKQTNTPICFLYKQLTPLDNGKCSNYAHRGLICRLFGYSANTDKYNNKRLSTCKLIKINQTEKYNSVVLAISSGLQVPIIADYYMQLNQIDFNLSKQVLPINQALRLAIEEVLQYYAYRAFPA